MLFLLNEVVFHIDPSAPAPPFAGRPFRRLSVDCVRTLGRELYACHPLLQIARPDRARRLAALIALKAHPVNAALFVAPAYGCAPEQVHVRFAQISFEVMDRLCTRQKDGELTNLVADAQVWRRLAA